MACSRGFEKVSVVVGVVGVGFFVVGVLVLVEEVFSVFGFFGVLETGIELWVLGGEFGGIVVCRCAAKVEAEL